VLRRILEMKDNGIGIVMITHMPEHAFLCAGQVALFYRSRRVCVGPTAEVLTEKALEEAYGIRVKVSELTQDGGAPVTACVPLIR
jgi:iron complex transport system ATP-binding protein